MGTTVEVLSPEHVDEAVVRGTSRLAGMKVLREALPSLRLDRLAGREPQQSSQSSLSNQLWTWVVVSSTKDAIGSPKEEESPVEPEWFPSFLIRRDDGIPETLLAGPTGDERSNATSLIL